MRHGSNSAVLLITLLAMQALAADPVWRGTALAEYIEHLSELGVRVIYSDDLVSDDLQVIDEPVGGDLVESLRRVLQPHAMKLAAGPGGNWLVVRDPDARNSLAEVDVRPALAASDLLPEVIVSSSRYNIRYQQPGSHTFLDRDFASNLPDVGEETLRSIDRMPGVASGGISTRSHVRGGAANEQLILLDGLRLYEPYHLKDFHAISTIIDQSAIDGLDLYTAGYQARYGDRMSGVIDIGLRARPTETQIELGVSFFNTSILSSGRFADGQRGDWLVSARRSNLDLISRAVKKGYGSPKFEDVLTHVGWQWTDRTYVAANFLYSHDAISVSQVDDSERATARYRNSIGWLKVETDWSDAVSTTTILSASDIANSRDGQVYVPDTVSGSVTDSRDFSSFGVKQDWTLDTSADWSFRAGFDFKLLDAEYDYDSTLSIAPPFDQILDNQPFLQRSISTRPEGEQYAAYVEARWRVRENFILDIGYRFDRQTYSVANTNEQRSPRLNLLYKPNDRTELRAGIGRFYQAQEINELQINGGITEFFGPQYSNHAVASVLHHFDGDIDLRIEVYQKAYHSLIPRFENVFNALVLLPEPVPSPRDAVRVLDSESDCSSRDRSVSQQRIAISRAGWGPGMHRRISPVRR